jgi:fructoselysine-6-P-deglycase FrlB-like protein
MDAAAKELASQPACWRRAASMARDCELLLPHFGEHVAVVGWGASAHAAGAYAWLRQAAGHGPTEAFGPTEIPPFRTFDRAIVLTATGEDPWTVTCLERLREEAIITTVVTADDGSSAARLAGHLIPLSFASERVAGTRFGTSFLALARAHLGEEMDPAISEAESAIAQPVSGAAAFASHVFLGHGWTVGLANAAASTFRHRELVASSGPAAEWQELTLAGDGTLVWVFGSPDASIPEELARAGATIRLAEGDPMAELVRAQVSAAG